MKNAKRRVYSSTHVHYTPVHNMVLRGPSALCCLVLVKYVSRQHAATAAALRAASGCVLF